jgi:phospholipid/cholesterol/gamma-HCH transport system permease protein
MKKDRFEGVRDVLKQTGEISRFTAQFFKEVFRPRYEVREFLRQSFIIGYQSIPLTAITAFIMGLVLTIQSRPTLEEFGAASWLPSMVAVSLVREIGPVITALICAGKIGSSVGAELGSMKVTEQIDAMEVSGTNPFKYLVVTRVLATTFMIPILVVLSDAIGIFGSFLGVNMKGVTSLHLFYSQVFEKLSYGDVLPATIKTFFFGFAIGIIGCYKGYNSNKGTEGVGESANTAVVVSSLLVFILDLLAVQVADLLGLT